MSSAWRFSRAYLILLMLWMSCSSFMRCLARQTV